jgi:hypothetical protein
MENNNARSAILAAILEAAGRVLGGQPTDHQRLEQARRIAAFVEVREWRENLDDRDMVEIVLTGLPPFDFEEWLDLQAQLCNEGCEVSDILLKIEEAL